MVEEVASLASFETNTRTYLSADIIVEINSMTLNSLGEEFDPERADYILKEIETIEKIGPQLNSLR